MQDKPEKRCECKKNVEIIQNISEKCGYMHKHENYNFSDVFYGKAKSTTYVRSNNISGIVN